MLDQNHCVTRWMRRFPTTFPLCGVIWELLGALYGGHIGLTRGQKGIVKETMGSLEDLSSL